MAIIQSIGGNIDVTTSVDGTDLTINSGALSVSSYYQQEIDIFSGISGIYLRAANDFYFWNCSQGRAFTFWAKGYASNNFFQIVSTNDNYTITGITCSVIASNAGCEGVDSGTTYSTYGWSPSSTYNNCSWKTFMQNNYYMASYVSDDNKTAWVNIPFSRNNYGEDVTSYLGQKLSITISLSDTSGNSTSGTLYIEPMQSSNTDLPVYCSPYDFQITYTAHSNLTSTITTKSSSMNNISLWIVPNSSNYGEWYNDYSFSGNQFTINVPRNSALYDRYCYYYFGEDGFTKPKNVAQTNNGVYVDGWVRVYQDAVNEGEVSSILFTSTYKGIVNPGSITYDHNAQNTTQYFLNYNEATLGSIYTDHPEWASISNIHQNIEVADSYTWNTFQLTFTGSNEVSTRSCMLYITYIDQDGETQTESCVVYQTPYASLYMSPEQIQFYADGNAKETNTSYLKNLPSGDTITDISVSVDGNPDWYSFNYFYDDTKGNKNYFVFSDVEEWYSTTESRTSDLTVNFTILTSVGNTIYRTCTMQVFQLAALNYTDGPIWQDAYYTLGYADYSSYNYYRITDVDKNFKVLYTGKLLWLNEDTQINICVNDIARDYINFVKNPIETYKSKVSSTYIIPINNNGYIRLNLQISADGTNYEDIYRFYLYQNYDYELEDNTDFSKHRKISYHILDYVDSRQILLFSAQNPYGASNLPANFTLCVQGVPGTRGTEYGTSDLDIMMQKTIIVDVPKWLAASPTLTTIYPTMKGNITGTGFYYNVFQDAIKIKDTCNDYAVYYMTPQGGWSWMLFDGKRINKQAITNNNYRTSKFNDKFYNRSNVQYLKEIKETWELTTNYLTDYQSDLMQGLITSPYLYLHDLNTGNIYAVNEIDTSVDKKTFGNQGRKFFTYTIKLENSQQKIKM